MELGLSFFDILVMHVFPKLTPHGEAVHWKKLWEATFHRYRMGTQQAIQRELRRLCFVAVGDGCYRFEPKRGYGFLAKPPVPPKPLPDNSLPEAIPPTSVAVNRTVASIEATESKDQPIPPADSTPERAHTGPIERCFRPGETRVKTITVEALDGIKPHFQQDLYQAITTCDNQDRLLVCLYFMSDLPDDRLRINEIERNLRKIFPPSLRDGKIPDDYVDFQATLIRFQFNAETRKVDNRQLSSINRLWENPRRGCWRNTALGNQRAVAVLRTRGLLVKRADVDAPEPDLPGEVVEEEPEEQEPAEEPKQGERKASKNSAKHRGTPLLFVLIVIGVLLVFMCCVFLVGAFVIWGGIG